MPARVPDTQASTGTNADDERVSAYSRLSAIFRAHGVGVAKLAEFVDLGRRKAT